MAKLLAFCVQLKHEREKHGWTQEDLAAQLRVNARTIGRWERGEDFPRPYHQQKLCKLFNKSLQEFGLLAKQVDGAPPVLSYSSIQPETQSSSSPDSFPATPPPDNGPVYKNITGFPPPTHPGVIQQRQEATLALYHRLLQPDVSAIVLTGIGGQGKSTLAALVYNYAQILYQQGQGFFTAEPLWLTFHKNVTVFDVIGTLYQLQGHPVPDRESLTPQNQAFHLFRALNIVANKRLIVLDQFENILDWQTGSPLAEKPGFGEWLDTINSQPCTSKVLLTSRLWPKGTRQYPSAYLQEYPVENLSVREGIELLKMQGIKKGQATEHQLSLAVNRCSGHPLALTLLALLFANDQNLNLSLLFNQALYNRLWQGDIAQELLQVIYREQLNALQKKLLFAFSIYREAVPLPAILAVIDLDEEEEAQVMPTLAWLIKRYILQPLGNALYQVHTLVIEYVRSSFLQSQEKKHRQILYDAHGRAAHYYLLEAQPHDLPAEQRIGPGQVQLFVEAAWHLSQAQRWHEAYHLICREQLFSTLRRWGGNALLLELYQQLLPLKRWQPEETQEADIYDQLGRVYTILGNQERALHYCRQALDLYHAIGNPTGKSKALHHMGLIYESLENFQQAREFHEQARQLAALVGNVKTEADSLNGLGWTYHQLGQQEEALQYCNLALRIQRKRGDRVGEGNTLHNLGLISQRQHKQEDAFNYYTQALVIRQASGNRGSEGKTLNQLGLVYAEAGENEKAYDSYRQSLAIRQETGDRHGEGIVFCNLGRLFLHLQRYDLALACLLLAAQIFQETRSGQQAAVQKWITAIQEALGQNAYERLLDSIEAATLRIVKETMEKPFSLLVP